MNGAGALFEYGKHDSSYGLLHGIEIRSDVSTSLGDEELLGNA